MKADKLNTDLKDLSKSKISTLKTPNEDHNNGNESDPLSNYLVKKLQKENLQYMQEIDQLRTKIKNLQLRDYTDELIEEVNSSIVNDNPNNNHKDLIVQLLEKKYAERCQKADERIKNSIKNVKDQIDQLTEEIERFTNKKKSS